MNKRAHRQQAAAEQAARAAALLQDGQVAQARDLFVAALRKDAGSYEAQLGLAQALVNLDHPNADAAFAKAAKLSPDPDILGPSKRIRVRDLCHRTVLVLTMPMGLHRVPKGDRRSNAIRRFVTILSGYTLLTILCTRVRI